MVIGYEKMEFDILNRAVCSICFLKKAGGFCLNLSFKLKFSIDQF